MAAILRGAKIGSRSLRNFLCSGGSIWSGIMGRLFLRSTASMLEEKISGCRRAKSISSLRDRRTPGLEPMSMDSTGMSSRSILKVGCGLAAMSASMAASGPASPYPPPSVSVSVSVSLSMGLLRTDLQDAVD